MGVPQQQEKFPIGKRAISFPICSTEKRIFNGIIYCSVETSIQPVVIGLCSDCNNNDHCPWKENQKIFCEHYQ